MYKHMRASYTAALISYIYVYTHTHTHIHTHTHTHTHTYLTYIYLETNTHTHTHTARVLIFHSFIYSRIWQPLRALYLTALN